MGSERYCKEDQISVGNAMSLDWLNNNWVVGLGTGIISGLVVFLVTRWLFASQSKREFEQKVAAANKELILSIRPGIPEGEMPTPMVLNALISATARKYGLKRSELLTVLQVTQDLIKEVMDSAFISSSYKNDYCNKLADIGMKSHIDEEFSKLSTIEVIDKTDTNRSTYVSISFILGMGTAATVASVNLLDIFAKGSSLIEVGDVSRTIFIPAIAVVSAIFASLMTSMGKRLFRRYSPDSAARQHNERDERSQNWSLADDLRSSDE